MTGLVLMFVVGVWFALAVTMAYALTLPIKITALRSIAGLIVFVAILVLPVMDEIVGGAQFRALCDKNAVFRVGVEQPKGRVVRFSANPRNEIVPGVPITIYHSRVEYTDTQTGESVVTFDEYVAKGGAFIRTLGISENNSPITMGKHFCSPEQIKGEAVHRTFKFSVIN